MHKITIEFDTPGTSEIEIRHMSEKARPVMKDRGKENKLDELLNILDSEG